MNEFEIERRINNLESELKKSNEQISNIDKFLNVVFLFGILALFGFSWAFNHYNEHLAEFIKSTAGK